MLYKIIIGAGNSIRLQESCRQLTISIKTFSSDIPKSEHHKISKEINQLQNEESIKQLKSLFLNDQLIISSLLQSDYNTIDSYLNSDSDSFANVLNLIDSLCAFNVSLKILNKIKHDNINEILLMLDTKILADYACKLIKDHKRYSLRTHYVNIDWQMKLNQDEQTHINIKHAISISCLTEAIYGYLEGDHRPFFNFILNLAHVENETLNASLLLTVFRVKQDLLNELPSWILDEYRKNLSKHKHVKKSYYEPSELENIVFVDSKEKLSFLLNEFRTHKNDHANVIGLDCEWKPILTKGISSNEISIFQIANRKTIYVIDMLNFMKTLKNDDLEEFFELVLFSNDIVKLAVSFNQDAKRLMEAFPQYKDRFNLFMSNLININDLVNVIESLHPEFFESKLSLKNAGKKKLVQKMFGAELKTSQTLSNWNSRPLKPSQLKYAALDALIYVKTYDIILERCKQHNINLNNIISNNFNKIKHKF